MISTLPAQIAGSLRATSDFVDRQPDATPKRGPVAEARSSSENLSHQPRIVHAQKVERIQHSEEARELRAVTHTPVSPPAVQAFVTVSKNGMDVHTIDLYV